MGVSRKKDENWWRDVFEKIRRKDKFDILPSITARNYSEDEGRFFATRKWEWTEVKADGQWERG